MQIHISRVFFPLSLSITLSSRVSFIPIDNRTQSTNCKLNNRFSRLFAYKIRNKNLDNLYVRLSSKKKKKFIKSKKLEIVDWTVDSRDYFRLVKHTKDRVRNETYNSCVVACKQRRSNLLFSFLVYAISFQDTSNTSSFALFLAL